MRTTSADRPLVIRDFGVDFATTYPDAEVRRRVLDSRSEPKSRPERVPTVAGPSTGRSNPKLSSGEKRLESPPVAAERRDAVHFGVTCPERLASPDMVVVDVWAFLAAHRQRVLDAAMAEHRERVSLVSQGPVRVFRGTELHARLWFDGLDVPDPLNSILWEGEVGKATFVVKVPTGLSPGPRRGKVTILLAGVPLAHLSCVVTIGAGAHSGSVRGARTSSFECTRHRRAFASYASRDRREVAARVQGLEKAGVDVFLDVQSLRSGERYEARLMEEIAARDVFYLFWSKAASASQWVEKEWRFALARRGLDFIDPIPLVPPDQVPPPKELADSLHFTDWTLAYTSAMALAPRRWWQIWRT